MLDPVGLSQRTAGMFRVPGAPLPPASGPPATGSASSNDDVANGGCDIVAVKTPGGDEDNGAAGSSGNRTPVAEAVAVEAAPPEVVEATGSGSGGEEVAPTSTGTLAAAPTGG